MESGAVQALFSPCFGFEKTFREVSLLAQSPLRRAFFRLAFGFHGVTSFDLNDNVVQRLSSLNTNL
jgi:hypothetical protein